MRKLVRCQFSWAIHALDDECQNVTYVVAHWVTLASLNARVRIGNPEAQFAVDDHLPVDDWRRHHAKVTGTLVEIPWAKHLTSRLNGVT